MTARDYGTRSMCIGGVLRACLLATLLLAGCGSQPTSSFRYFSKTGLAWKYGYVHRIRPEAVVLDTSPLDGLAVKRVHFFSPLDPIGGFVMGNGFGRDAIHTQQRSNMDAASVAEFESLASAVRAGLLRAKWAKYEDLFTEYDWDYGRVYALARLDWDQGILDAPTNQWADAAVAEIFLIHVTPAVNSLLRAGSGVEYPLVAIPSDHDSEAFLVMNPADSERVINLLKAIYTD